ncbi:MAG: hypothetical protein OSA89_12065, partial [Mariniblastus sp.]|nr:hypothetical protein [Mariniblastus sp.]
PVGDEDSVSSESENSLEELDFGESLAVVPRDELGDEPESEGPDSSSPPPVGDEDSVSSESENSLEENEN